MSKKIIGIVLVMLLVVTFVTTLMMQNNEVQALSKYGSRGSEVRTIQDKLKRWGYYTGNVDGIYGTKTVNAVKYFQRKNGLTADGIAGPATLRAMGIMTSSNSNSSFGNPSILESDFNSVNKISVCSSIGYILSKLYVKAPI